MTVVVEDRHYCMLGTLAASVRTTLVVLNLRACAHTRLRVIRGPVEGRRQQV